MLDIIRSILTDRVVKQDRVEQTDNPDCVPLVVCLGVAGEHALVTLPIPRPEIPVYCRDRFELHAAEPDPTSASIFLECNCG